jgi:hydrolase, ortholog 1, exosortase system type 1 associated
MTRRHFTFACEGANLAGTIDGAQGTTGLLIVTGGNETRAGAWNGQARFAARIAEAGFPVMRFDRRGAGDSEGRNDGFRSCAPDLAAALGAFREQIPHVRRIVAFGNCDAASALMLARGAGIDALVLSNPWTIESDDEEAPAEVIRDHYRRRLSDPAAIARLLTGKVSPLKLVRSLVSALGPAPKAPQGLAAAMADGISGFPGPIHFLIAGRDRTGLAFLAKWDKADPRIRICPGASHSYVEPEAQEWLAAQVIEALRG